MAKQLLVMNLSVEGERSLQMALQVPLDAIKDMDPAWEEIRDSWAAANKKWLDSEGRGSFAPLSPRYAALKVLQVGAKPILQFSGRLYNSLTDTGDGEFFYAPEKLRVTLGTTVPYSRVHQNPRANNPLPRRPPLKMDKRIAITFAKIIQAHLFKIEPGTFSQSARSALRAPGLKLRRR